MTQLSAGIKHWRTVNVARHSLGNVTALQQKRVPIGTMSHPDPRKEIEQVRATLTQF